MTLTEATKNNLRRKSAYVDQVQVHKGVPLWSWLELSITELCNRKCVFCPRVDDAFYPNQNLHMSWQLAASMADELKDLDYKGGILFCGYGEPLLHPKLADMVAEFVNFRVEIVTNGDRLTPDRIRELVVAGADYFVVSAYDGPHQIEPFHAMFKEAGFGEQHYIIRDRWHSDEDDYGLKLTNRGGTVAIGNQAPVLEHAPCHYLAYQMTVDWNGDVILCPQDWHKKLKFGNIASESMFEIWTSRAMHKRRMQLIEGRRCEAPCNACNTDGTLHGFNHVPLWTGR